MSTEAAVNEVTLCPPSLPADSPWWLQQPDILHKHCYSIGVYHSKLIAIPIVSVWIGTQSILAGAFDWSYVYCQMSYTGIYAINMIQAKHTYNILHIPCIHMNSSHRCLILSTRVLSTTVWTQVRSQVTCSPGACYTNDITCDCSKNMTCFTCVFHVWNENWWTTMASALS